MRRSIERHGQLTPIIAFSDGDRCETLDGLSGCVQRTRWAGRRWRSRSRQGTACRSPAIHFRAQIDRLTHSSPLTSVTSAIARRGRCRPLSYLCPTFTKSSFGSDTVGIVQCQSSDRSLIAPSAAISGRSCAGSSPLS
jgi:hypothetical protein